MRRSTVLLAALVAAAVVLTGVYSAMAQSNPQPEKKENPREKLKDYYVENDEKVKSFTYKETPAFKLYKPGESWHFVDMSRYQSAEVQKARTPQQRQQIDSFFKICKCILHSGELNSEAAVFVSTGVLRKSLDLVMQDLENAVKKNLPDYKRISCKGKKKNGATGACLVFEGTAKGQPKDTHVWYILVKGTAVYQLRMACGSDKYEDAKKDFDKIYSKWKF